MLYFLATDEGGLPLKATWYICRRWCRGYRPSYMYKDLTHCHAEAALTIEKQFPSCFGKALTR